MCSVAITMGKQGWVLRTSYMCKCITYVYVIMQVQQWALDSGIKLQHDQAQLMSGSSWIYIDVHGKIHDLNLFLMRI